MSKKTLPYFGEIDTNSLEEYYDAEIEFNGKTIELDLNFEDESIDESKIKLVEKFLEDLPKLNEVALKAVKDDFETGDTAEAYASFHLEELDEETINELLQNADTSLSKKEQLISVLYLTRVGFYPHGIDNFATFDYTINDEITNYLVVVEINESGEINYITMES